MSEVQLSAPISTINDIKEDMGVKGVIYTNTFENVCPICGNENSLIPKIRKPDTITCSMTKGGCNTDFSVFGWCKVNSNNPNFMKKLKNTKDVDYDKE
jgi:hypothetical protein